ncbi:serine hydrolase domain-containing protein [Herbiconiux ginsengi]|uniref:CubicO group peptidase, beta-lactamase class C family n=1 Tax=Herbiconiux ginsengi TaxID=381665 RepID=A0A1H3JGB0_9MICO|nr:serine hydrolase domain-containing protein [Herbiconiux ginsengi]SDY38951.1 CubicO group peptidase, beta-lactamase class C family [Herbiconiux ginsengi]
MRSMGIAAALASLLLLTACTTAPSQASSPASSSPDDSTATDGCPAGTSEHDGLCLSGDATSVALAEVLHRQFEADHLTATIAGVWHDGEPVLFGALGDSLPGVPATPDMHHMLGNLTTPMLTTAFLQQVEAGVISLDEPISTWYPDLPDADTVTVDMLLHNTAGYSQFTGQADFLADLYADPFRVWTVDEIIDIGTEGGPVFPPGSDWMFSDTNSAVLVGILAKATDRRVEDLIQTGVLDPLGMRDTTVTRDGNWKQPILQGYDGERGVWENVTGWSPSWAHFAGGVGSNAQDVGTFLDALASGELLSSKYHDIQWAPTTVGIGANTPDQYWAMGFLVVKDWMFLNPTIPGYSGAGATLPDEGWTIVVYTTPSQATDPAAPSATDITRAFTGILSPEHSLAG